MKQFIINGRGICSATEEFNTRDVPTLQSIGITKEEDIEVIADIAKRMYDNGYWWGSFDTQNLLEPDVLLTK